MSGLVCPPPCEHFTFYSQAGAKSSSYRVCALLRLHGMFYLGTTKGSRERASAVNRSVITFLPTERRYARIDEPVGGL